MRISDWSSDVCSSDLQRLQHQPLGDEQLVLRLEADRDIALLADEERRIDLEELRCKTLQAEHGIGSLRIRLEVVAHADRCIAEFGAEAAVGQKQLGCLARALQRLPALARAEALGGGG